MCEFYCQREIECNTPCKDQCEHCKIYYSPIESKECSKNNCSDIVYEYGLCFDHYVQIENR